MNALIQYKSSAGSGKTFTLVLEYLKIVMLEPYDYRHILAITFTNKATDEMKSRIIENLSELAHTSGDALTKLPTYQLLKEFLEERGQADKIDISYQARKTLNLILSDYSSFSVSTIESFFQRVLRAFAKELNIPLGYEVDMQLDVTLDHIIQETFREVGLAAEVTRLLEGYLERNMEDEKGWRIESSIKNLGFEIFKEQFQALLVAAQSDEKSTHATSLQAVEALEKEVWKRRRTFEQAMHKRAKEAVALLESAGLGPSDFKWGAKGCVPNYFYKVLKDQAYAPGARALKAARGENEWFKDGAPTAVAILDVLDAGLQRLLEEMVAHYDAGFLAYTTAYIVSQTIHSFGLMSDLQSKLVNYRNENNRLVISDTSYLLKSIISEKDTPFVYEKVGTRYKYYLIDEFQDTSDMQWENLKPLVLEALASGSESLIVGDVKQSIYRWRNGNMSLLMRVVEEQLKERGQQVSTRHLLNNWRTAPEVVSFNNRFFELAATALGQEFPELNGEVFEKAYNTVAQKPMKKGDRGYVSITFFDDKKRGDPPETPSWQDQAMERCEALIRELLVEGYRANDICLLVRRNADGERIAAYLQEHYIKVSSTESLKLEVHPGVLLLHAILSHLNYEGDSIHLARAAYYHYLVERRERPQGQQKLNFTPEHVVPHELFTAGEKYLPKLFLRHRNTLRQLPVYECLERLLHYFPNLPYPNAYLQGFLDTALEYGSAQDGSISGFLSYWEEVKHKKAIAGAAEVDAVQVMTIHKAKGLEFPVVILPLADWDLAPKTGSIIWVQPQAPPYNDFPFLPIRYGPRLEDSIFNGDHLYEKVMSYLDNLNMLYVAFTRPQNRLYVLTTASKKNRTGKLIQQVIGVGGEEGLGLIEKKEGNHYIRGEKQPYKPKDLQVIDSFLLSKRPTLFADWNQTVRIRYSSNRYLKAGILERTERLEAGELLHEALAHVKHLADVPAAVERLALSGYISHAEKSAFEQRLRMTISLPEVIEWFDDSWEVRNESDIITASGPILRPDRVMIKDNKAIIIDYKTGHKKQLYTKQVSIYKEALEAIGYEDVRGFLYYTELGKVEEV